MKRTIPETISRLGREPSAGRPTLPPDRFCPVRGCDRAAESLALLVAPLLFFALPGCAALPLLHKSETLLVADATHPAVEILAIWQTAEGPGPGGVPVRGFGGQVFFFTRDKPQAAIVDGNVRIYLFDDHGTLQEQGKPIHQFDYDTVAWNAHLQKTHLGPAYSVFIPYTRDDFHQAACSLRVRFIPRSGPTIFSSMSTLVLPGPPLKSEDKGDSRLPTFSQNQAKAKLPPDAALPWSDRFNGPDPMPTAFARRDTPAQAPAKGEKSAKPAQAAVAGSSGSTPFESEQEPEPAPSAGQRRIRVKLKGAASASATSVRAAPRGEFESEDADGAGHVPLDEPVRRHPLEN